MYYETSLTIPAGTLKDSPVETVLKLTHGVVHRVEVEFPDGPSFLAGVAILYGPHQVWPTNPEGCFASNGHTIGFDDYYQMYFAPYALTIQGWAPEADYDHDVRVRVGVLPQAIAEYVYGKMTQSQLLQLQEAFGLTGEVS
jgi:hypothetical protein